MKGFKMSIFRRKAKSRLKATRKAKKAEKKRRELLRKHFRVAPVFQYGRKIDEIYLKDK